MCICRWPPRLCVICSLLIGCVDLFRDGIYYALIITVHWFPHIIRKSVYILRSQINICRPTFSLYVHRSYDRKSRRLSNEPMEKTIWDMNRATCGISFAMIIYVYSVTHTKKHYRPGRRFKLIRARSQLFQLLYH